MKARKIMEAPHPAWEMRVRACTVALSKIGLCGQPPTETCQLEARPMYPERPGLGQAAPFWDRSLGSSKTVTRSRAKKVRWLQRHTVPLAPSSVEQPSEDQSPVGPGWEGRKKGRESTREEGKETERREERRGALWVEPLPLKGAHTFPTYLTQRRSSRPYL